MDCRLRLLCPWNFPANNSGVGSHSLLQGIFQTQGSNPKVVSLLSEPPGKPCPWISSVQLLSHVRLFATPWITARQASLSITNSRNSLKLMSIKSVIEISHPQSSPSPPASNPSQNQGLFQWVSSLHEVAKVLEYMNEIRLAFICSPHTQVYPSLCL